jgi:hypothetical protein
MPIFVQWKWQEKTKSFLVIFHFFDDYSKPNLRIKKDLKYPKITWSPSHVELALFSELLSYANIIDGLTETEKRKLKAKLTGISPKMQEELGEAYNPELLPDEELREYIMRPKLCLDYIEYLRKVLKPYLRRC